MPNVISALTARTQLGQILKRASENNERFVIGRRGEPKAVIMGLRDYIEAIAPPPDWLKAAWDDAKRKGVDKLTMREIDAEIAAVRREQKERRRVERATR